MSLRTLAPDLYCVDFEQTLPGRFHLPARMTVVRLGGGLLLHSPVPLDDATRNELERLGPIAWLVAPNRLHSLYLTAAQQRYPDALTFVAPTLPAKRPAIRCDHHLEDGAPFGTGLDALGIAGAPGADEFVFLHRPSRSLIVTDLLFHITRPRGVVAGLALRLMGAHGRLAQSRTWRVLTRDRAAAAHACRALLAWDFDRLVPAHGEVIDTGAKPRVREALAWMARG